MIILIAKYFFITELNINTKFLFFDFIYSIYSKENNFFYDCSTYILYIIYYKYYIYYK